MSPEDNSNQTDKHLSKLRDNNNNNNNNTEGYVKTTDYVKVWLLKPVTVRKDPLKNSLMFMAVILYFMRLEI